MKLLVSLACYNGRGSSASIEIEDEDGCGDSIHIVEGFSYSPQETCRRAAKKLREAAARFDLLAGEKKDLIYKCGTHNRVNCKKMAV